MVSGTFWSALGALATAAGAIAILYTAKQLRFQAWVKAQEIWTSERFTIERGKIFSRLDTLPALWTPEDKGIGLDIYRQTEEFVRLAPFFTLAPFFARYFGERQMQAVWGDGFAKTWVILAPLVIEERKKTAQPTKWDAFEWVGKDALRTRLYLRDKAGQVAAG